MGSEWFRNILGGEKRTVDEHALNETQKALLDAAERLEAQVQTFDDLSDEHLSKKVAELAKLGKTLREIEGNFTERMVGVSVFAVMTAAASIGAAFSEEIQGEHTEQVLAAGGGVVAAALVLGLAFNKTRRLLERAQVRRKADRIS